jgi:hypothetical protein
MDKNKQHQAGTDLRDERGGTYDGKPPLRPATPVDLENGPSERMDENTPEGLQREPKGPLNKTTGRA